MHKSSYSNKISKPRAIDSCIFNFVSALILKFVKNFPIACHVSSRGDDDDDDDDIVSSVNTVHSYYL